MDTSQLMADIVKSIHRMPLKDNGSIPTLLGSRRTFASRLALDHFGPVRKNEWWWMMRVWIWMHQLMCSVYFQKLEFKHSICELLMTHDQSILKFLRLTTNSLIWSFRRHRVLNAADMLGCHGFPLHRMDWGRVARMVSVTTWNKFAGNTMSVPVVGSVLLAVARINDGVVICLADFSS